VKLVFQLFLSLALLGFTVTSIAETRGLLDCTHHLADASTHEKPQKQDLPTKHLDCSCFSVSVILPPSHASFSGSSRSDRALSWKERSWPQFLLSPALEPPRLI